MPSVTLSSKNQITLPAEMVRRLGLKGGDKLVAELIDDHIVLLPQPESWVDYFAGRFKGVWGNTKEEVSRYIYEVREGLEIDNLKKQLALDPQLQTVYEATSKTEARTGRQIAQRTSMDLHKTVRCLDTLLSSGLRAVELIDTRDRHGDTPYVRTS